MHVSVTIKNMGMNAIKGCGEKDEQCVGAHVRGWGWGGDGGAGNINMCGVKGMYGCFEWQSVYMYFLLSVCGRSVLGSCMTRGKSGGVQSGVRFGKGVRGFWWILGCFFGRWRRMCVLVVMVCVLVCTSYLANMAFVTSPCHQQPLGWSHRQGA